ncbi:hypothetical protein LAZ67_7001810 [Cordylochernes scorpioides]|uniref:CCHC-type domain-containing protein n=1 Tax=Cordylochernes scorpioides TaxID=51811 RepID=A0ABY6KMM0_9ARAC|nr:hypothetical protein LAZ67_7001810 [Cordylochernes scorpioides]
MKINPRHKTRSYRNCNNCYNTQLTPDHISAILAALYMADINPEEDIHTDNAPRLAGIVIRVHGRSDLLHGQDTTTLFIRKPHLALLWKNSLRVNSLKSKSVRIKIEKGGRAEINNYELVVKKFEEHFIGKRNVIFERAQFNRRYQQDGEAVEEYIRVLHKMAENCNYGSLKEEMIRDRIVVGVKNLQLSEKLQLEPNLTLERDIQAACQTMYQVYEKKLPPRRFNSIFGKRDASKKSKFQKWSKPENSGCIRCGASKFHPYKDCPAKEVKCHKCKKVGHFAKVCYNKTVGQVTQGDDYHFVGNIYENGQNSNDWKVYVKADKIKILFKMDTGADVNIIPQEIYFKNFAHKKLCKPDIQL